MNEKVEKTSQPEAEMNAYKILLQRHLNDDRLMGERSSIFLASSSILFLGFVMLPPSACILRIIIPILGMLLSAFGFHSNWRTSKGLGFWEGKEKEIEENGQSFNYMKEKEMMPHLVYKRGRWPRNRHIYTYALPAIFLVLWMSSLIWVIWFS